MTDGKEIHGYCGKILRVDLTKREIRVELLDEDVLRQYIGGSALGIKFLYDEIPAGIEWSDAENRLFLGSGPLGGTTVGGSGTICGVVMGALTGGIGCSQANGFFGAYLRLSGFDAILIHGAASKWVYLHIHDGMVEIKDAAHIVGRDIYEVDDMIKQELHKKEREVSVLTIGPAGENLVRFALISVDKGHMIAHNGFGAVMGSKKLKAIVVDRGKNPIKMKDKEVISRLTTEIRTRSRKNKINDLVFSEGTIGGVVPSTKAYGVPVKNYTTNIHVIDPENLGNYTAQNIRNKFEAQHKPCWACQAKHCSMLKISEGRYAGRIFEEPEYELMAAWSSLVGISDVETTLLLASEVDRLGIDCNEAGWVISWVIECYEKRLLTKNDTDGLEMTWGNGESIMAMLNKIARREGFGNLLADGVMRASQHVGGLTKDLAVYTLKGNSPRGHDHRMLWQELFDTCVSNVGTIEAHRTFQYDLLGLPSSFDTFNHEVVSSIEAKIRGAMIFEDSLGTCRFQTATSLDLLCQAVNAVTGWNMKIDDAMTVGRRAVNLARLFNMRRGISAELDAPSVRYGSMLLDGPRAGKTIMKNWDEMLRNYYRLMGWDTNTGRPLPETFSKLGLAAYVRDLEKL